MSAKDEGYRFIGFAFASADLLFEVEPDDTIGFVVGAARRALGRTDQELLRQPWRALFDPCDHGVVAALFNGLSGVSRKGPVKVKLAEAPGRPAHHANVYACRLPQLGGAISCALSLGREGFGEDVGGEGGLLDKEVFEDSISRLIKDAHTAGLDVEMALVEVAGLAKALKTLPKADAQRTLGHISDVLRAESLRGAATQIEDERFAIVRERPDGEDTLTQRLVRAAADAGVKIEADAAVLPLEDAASSHALLALRFTLDQFLKDGLSKSTDLAATFREGLDDTLRQAKAFSENVQSGGFKLVYQPIVSLKDRSLHHYEALTRFPKGDQTFETIRMAEELDIIETFDLKVAEMVVRALKTQPPDVRIAVNLSGRSFLRPRFIDNLLKITGGDVRLKNRLIFEITESSALANLELADERIQRLRREGYEVCIDDFGAGAASLNYLRSLGVDAVKIDGQFVKQMSQGGKDAIFVRHLAAMCRELEVRTIAEMIETDQVAASLKSFGVDYGQGFLFGAPLLTLPSSQAPARRTGVVTSWG